jgi:hypothetical protein
MMETMMSGPLFLYVDCETIPSQDPAILERIQREQAVPPVDLSALVADGRLTDPARIEADLERKREKALADHEIDLAKAEAKGDAAYRKLCLHGATAHIACVHYSFGDDEVAGHLNTELETFDGKYKVPTFQEVLEGEKEMLVDFFAELRTRIFEIARERAEAEWAKTEAVAASAGLRTMGREAWIEESRRHYVQVPIVVAHSADFDIRMIWQRAKILGVALPVWWPITFNRYRDDEVQDTMVMWSGHQDRISLDDLCVALGIPGKSDGLDGSQVWNAVQAGQVWEVFKYCGEDVERCRAVHQRLRGPATSGVATPGICRQCGCTDDEGCENGCCWVEPDLCSECVDPMFEAAASAADADHGVGAEGGAA